MNLDDLKEFLEQHNIEVRGVGEHHHATRGWLQVDCPYCSSKGSDTFRLGLTTRSANCWHCGPKYLLRALIDLTNQPASVCRRYFDTSQYNLPKAKKTRGRLEIPDGVNTLQLAHRNKLREWGFNPTDLHHTWKLQGIGIASNLQWRIFIPVFLDGKMVSWTTRTIGDTGIKYLSAKADQEIINIKELLYGEDYCNHTIIVCEGPKDVWKIGPGAVATFGMDYSVQQALKIAQYPFRYICYDNEPKAQQQARKLCNELSVFPGETKNIVLQSKDPGEANESELIELRKLLNFTPTKRKKK